MKIFGLQKIQPKEMKIREGMTVDDVKAHGSKAQKLAASLFDFDGGENSPNVKDGIFSKAEAERFNNFDFSMKKGIFTMYDKKERQTIEIKYNNIKDLQSVLDRDLSFPDELLFASPGRNYVTLMERTEGGKITLDLTNNTVTADGVKGDSIIVDGYRENAIIQNSDLRKIDATLLDGKLEVKNTQLDRSLNKSEPTRILIDKDTKLKIDDVSDVDISRY